MHPLDNIIWQALTTRHAQFAEGSGQARRFIREVTSLAGFAEPSLEGYESLGRIVGVHGTAALFLDNRYESRSGWDLVAEAPLLQMVSEREIAPPAAHDAPKITGLGWQDSDEMVELTALTKPGPFGTRTHELGTYLGIRQDGDGKLMAMAGERLKVAGYTEVSAVCTHPDHTGKGYARMLMLRVMREIRERGETPCLHVRQDNQRAVELYERLGFRTRIIVHLAVLRKT
jgi:ribosomal protein S18 acetylase RimI-like enzyme